MQKQLLFEIRVVGDDRKIHSIQFVDTRMRHWTICSSMVARLIQSGATAAIFSMMVFTW